MPAIMPYPRVNNSGSWFYNVQVTTLWLSEADVRAVLPMPDLIEAMQAALVSFSSGDVVQPMRPVLELRDMTFFSPMPGFIRGAGVLGAKLVTVIPENAARGLPTHRATIVLLDPEDGALRAVMDGRYITEARTAAVSAVSVRHMARRDSKVLAILGSGVQARSHLLALSAVHKFEEVRAWSPTAAHLDKFVAECGGRVRAAASAEAACRDADVIVLATASVTPVIRSEWVRDGTHVIAVGACRPTHRETDSELVTRARVVVDSTASAFNEAGDILIPMSEGYFGSEHVAGELGQVIAGRVQGRASASEVTFFKSLGLAVEDLAAADMAWRRTVQR